MAFEINYVKNVKHEVSANGAVDHKDYIEAGCLSTDDKPTANIATGSIAVEANTGKVFFFDGTTWQEQFSFQAE